MNLKFLQHEYIQIIICLIKYIKYSDLDEFFKKPL